LENYRKALLEQGKFGAFPASVFKPLIIKRKNFSFFSEGLSGPCLADFFAPRRFFRHLLAPFPIIGESPREFG
jgi:hypothetical protein